MIYLISMHSFVVITPFREFEQQRELRERGLQTTSDESAARKISSSEDAIIDHMDKVSAIYFANSMMLLIGCGCL